jgi:transposase-like protein
LSKRFVGLLDAAWWSSTCEEETTIPPPKRKLLPHSVVARTQVLLSRFAEENSRLARENDRLGTARTVGRDAGMRRAGPRAQGCWLG